MVYNNAERKRSCGKQITTVSLSRSRSSSQECDATYLAVLEGRCLLPDPSEKSDVELRQLIFRIVLIKDRSRKRSTIGQSESLTLSADSIEIGIIWLVCHTVIAVVRLFDYHLFRKEIQNFVTVNSILLKSIKTFTCQFLGGRNDLASKTMKYNGTNKTYVAEKYLCTTI